MSLIEENNKMDNRFYSFTKLISWLGVLLSISLLVYVYYRAEITYGGNYNDVYFKYYIASIVCVFFWIAVLRLKDKLRTNIVMVVISIVVSLYLIEVSLQFYQNQNQDIQFEDRRTKVEVLDDFIN